MKSKNNRKNKSKRNKKRNKKRNVASVVSFNVPSMPQTETPKGILYLHEVILGRKLEEDEMIMFINGDVYDYREHNLKIIQTKFNPKSIK